MAFIMWILTIAGVDLCIKEEIEARDGGDFPKELEGSGGKIILHKSHNTGFPFEVLKSRPELVRMIPIVVASGLAGILGFLIPRKGFLAEKLALVLTLGGALSNLYDRMVRGYVVDYFSFNVGKLKKVIFNLGDLFILAGSLIILLSQTAAAIGDWVKAWRESRKS